MNSIKVLIIDDERLARAEMKLVLSSYSDLIMLGEAENAQEAEALIKSLRPDLIFLDVQMPVKSGFDMLESLTEVPEVIFTTAFDHYAVRAFELNALDYLIKPIRQERLEKAISKVKAKLYQNHRQLNYPKNIFIKEGEKYHFLKVEDILLIESIGNYARLHLHDQKVFFKRSLNMLEKSLDESQFFRINRSTIINVNFINGVQQQPNGGLIIQMKNGESYVVSIRQAALFKARNML